MAISDILLLSGGELSDDVAERVRARLSSLGLNVRPVSMSKSKAFKSALVEDAASATTLAIFVVSTIENEEPTEDAGACIRFFKRKTHPDTLLKCSFTVLGLGDSNLLLDRQHTSAKDCNQVATMLDSRLEALGAIRFHGRGECDERTGLTEVEPWIDQLYKKLENETSK